MRRPTRLVALALAAVALAPVVSPAAQSGPPYDGASEHESAVPDSLGFGTASASASADKTTGALSAAASASESLPTGAQVPLGENPGYGVSRAEATGTVSLVLEVSGAGSVAVRFTDIQTAAAASSTASAVSLLNGWTASTHALADYFFQTCPIGNACAAGQAGSASLVVARSDAPGPAPASAILTLSPALPGAGYVLVRASVYSAAFVRGAPVQGTASASASISATVSAISVP